MTLEKGWLSAALDESGSWCSAFRHRIGAHGQADQPELAQTGIMMRLVPEGRGNELVHTTD